VEGSEPDVKSTVAFLGAGGTMGKPMAANLAEAGYGVRAWNRSREKADDLRNWEVTVLDSPAEAVEGAGVIITMLSDADAVIATVEDLLADLADDAVWVQMSTIGLEGTERCAELADENGVTFVDAPVLGTKQPAEAGDLIVLASGPGEAGGDLEPLFGAMGKKIMWLGEAGAGTRLKLVLNSWILSVVEGAAETIALAEGMDVDPRHFLEAVSGGPLDLPYLQMKGKAMIERDFEPSFRLVLAAKDAGLVSDAAARHGLDLPVTEAIAERLAEGASEHADKDMSATFLTSAPEAPGA
jgi:3-hydroxyisobutyrate dehydrogenase